MFAVVHNDHFVASNNINTSSIKPVKNLEASFPNLFKNIPNE